MQRGVIDCAVTGTTNGNTAKWPEVTTHLYPMYMGWAVQYWGVNADTWSRLDPAVREFLDKKYAELDEALWKAAVEGERQGIDCSVGRDNCSMKGLTKYGMTFVPISDADAEMAKDIVQNTVLKSWAERCGADCVKEWNATVGKALGVTAPVPG